jgi:hypothetical protein
VNGNSQTQNLREVGTHVWRVFDWNHFKIFLEDCYPYEIFCCLICGTCNASKDLK